MAILDIPALRIQLDNLITTNGNQENTGAITNTMLRDIIDSLEAIVNNQYIEIDLLATSFTDPSNSKDILLTVLPAGYELQTLLIRHTTSVIGGSVSAANLTVGIVGELDKYTFEPFDVFSAVSGTNFLSEDVNTLEDFDNPTDIRIKLETTGDTLDNITDGVFKVYILLRQIKQ